jgi:hypothetical protein
MKQQLFLGLGENQTDIVTLNQLALGLTSTTCTHDADGHDLTIHMT